jgi:hypothetical protein
VRARPTGLPRPAPLAPLPELPPAILYDAYVRVNMRVMHLMEMIHDEYDGMHAYEHSQNDYRVGADLLSSRKDHTTHKTCILVTHH